MTELLHRVELLARSHCGKDMNKPWLAARESVWVALRTSASA